MLDIGSIVKYQDGFYSISKITKNSVNLRGVFGGKIWHKDIPLHLVKEAYNEWHEQWVESETYKCM